jgi:hypothetical protein
MAAVAFSAAGMGVAMSDTTSIGGLSILASGGGASAGFAGRTGTRATRGAGACDRWTTLMTAAPHNAPASTKITILTGLM